MKRLLFVVFDLLTLVFLAGIYGIRHFTKTNLGMVRWCNYFTKVYGEKMPLDTLKLVAILVALMLTVLIVLLCRKKEAEVKLIDKIMLLPLIILTVAYGFYTLTNSYPAKPDYYFVMPVLGGAVLMQVIRSFLAVLCSKKNVQEKQEQ